MLIELDDVPLTQNKTMCTEVDGKSQTRMCVLFVEDDPSCASTFTNALSQNRIDTVVVENLTYARRFLKDSGDRIDAVLLTLDLLDGRGEDLLPEIEALSRQPGIVLFGNSLDEIRLEATSYRATWASKSTKPSALASILRFAARGYAHKTISRFSRHFRLTGKEVDLLDRVSSGISPKRIALDMGCSLQAVYANLARVSSKVGCANYQEVIAKLFQFSCHGLGHELSPDETRQE